MISHARLTERTQELGQEIQNLEATKKQMLHNLQQVEIAILANRGKQAELLNLLATSKQEEEKRERTEEQARHEFEENNAGMFMDVRMEPGTQGIKEEIDKNLGSLAKRINQKTKEELQQLILGTKNGEPGQHELAAEQEHLKDQEKQDAADREQLELAS